ncbi:AlwI family type II restriction endonuclease [Limosilactobacillus reuteri]
MSSFKERFLFFSTHPRNPKLIKLILQVIKDNGLNNQDYNEDVQAAFYRYYTKASASKGGNSKNPDLAGRQLLTRAPQALGFLRTRKGHDLEISEAGNLLLDNDLYEDVLLHQLLKFQLPSPLHHEAENNTGLFCIKPFLEILRLTDTLGYLTYKEFLIYGMMMTDYHQFNDTVNQIKDYRNRRNVIKGHKSLKDFDHQEQLQIFKYKYHDLIERGDFKTRESKTPDIESFTKKKISNWRDYADAIFRALRETGLFVLSGGKTLSISSKRADEVAYILQNVQRTPVSEEKSRDDFDTYMFDPTQPKLLNDNLQRIKQQLNSLNIKFSSTASVYELKKELAKHRFNQRQNTVSRMVDRLKQRRREDIQDIIKTYEAIKNKDVVDRSTMMEWNTWRAVTMLDHGNIKGNFIPDDQGNPISTASGNQGDIIGDYGDFYIVYEVTLATGHTQYKMEGEPVTRHVGTLQKSSHRPAFGFFIANRLNPTTIQYFYTSSVMVSDLYSGSTSVIPLGLDDFIKFFKGAANKVLSEQDLQSLCEYAMNTARENMINGKPMESWYKDVRKHALQMVE